MFENPLVDAANGLDAHADNDHINLSVIRNKGRASATNLSNNEDEMDNGLTAQHQKYPSRYQASGS